MASQIAQLTNVSTLNTMVSQLIDAPIGQERMGCFYGPSGWGKSTAVSAVQILFDVIAIEVIENTSKLDVLDQIVDQIQVKSPRNVSARIRAIAGYMERTNRALIIDDAHYLIKRGMVGMARDIYNTAGGLVPVILVGEELLPQDLTRFENIHNRIAVWEGAQPCEMDDARRLASIYAKGVEVEEELLAEIVSKANGATRRVSNMLGKAREIAKQRGAEVVTRKLWGATPFFDGLPPAERKPAQLQPRVSLVSTSGAKAARQ